MTREKTITVTVCNNCGDDISYPEPCLQCGKNYCHDCSKSMVVDYSHGVYVCGSGDGRYCKTCDRRLREAEGSEPLHAAYIAIEDLKREQLQWGKSFEERRKNAEAHLASFARRMNR